MAKLVTASRPIKIQIFPAQVHQLIFGEMSVKR